MLIFILVTLLIIISFDLVSYFLNRKGWSRFSSTFLLAVFFVLISQFFLGLLSILTFANLVFWCIAFSTTAIVALYRKEGLSFFKNYSHSVKNSVIQVWHDTRQDPPFLVLLTLSLILITWIIGIGLISPVTDFDGNVYHMTTVAYIVQNMNIYDMQTSISWLAGYPKGGELLQLWGVLLSGKETFADLTQVPFLLMGIYAIYEIAKSLGISKPNARFIAWLFLFTPIVINQMKTTYVDIILVSLFFAAMALVIHKKPNRIDVLIIGMIFSILISVKSSGVLFVIAVLPFLLKSILEVKKKRFGLTDRAFLGKMGLVLLPLFFGLYWYIKNLILYGTPLYPFGFSIAGKSVFPGETFQDFISGAFTGIENIPSGTLSRIWFSWTEQKDWFGCLYNYDSTYSGLGPVWLVLLVPAIPTAAYIALKRRNFLFLTFIAVIFLLFMAYPANYYSRYVIFILIAGLLSLGILLSSQKKIIQNVIKTVAILLSMIVVTTTFTLCNYTPKALREQYNMARKNTQRNSSIYRNTVGSAYLYLQNIVKANEVVAYDSKPYFIYALWNENMTNKVQFVEAGNQEEWLYGLNEKKVKYVFTNKNSVEHSWASRSNTLESIYKDELYEIYKTKH